MQDLQQAHRKYVIWNKQVQTVTHTIKWGDLMSEMTEKDVVETIVRLLEDQTGEKLEYRLEEEQKDESA